MSAAKASGITPRASDVPIVIAMVARGDRNHDIAAWFGFNQGRIKEFKDGKFGPPTATKAAKLPPKGPPGVKGRHLREALDSITLMLNSGDNKAALSKLENALATYDADEK